MDDRVIRERRLAFGDVAETYDRVRPTYPDALFAEVVQVSNAASGDAVLEAGAGTGKATRKFVALGLAVTAVEPDPAMAAVGRRACPEASWVNASFDDAVIAPHSFALVASAQAWHWVRPEGGPTKAA